MQELRFWYEISEPDMRQEVGNMDFGSLSVSMAQSQLMTDVSTAILAKSMDTAEQTGAQVVDMIERSSMENSVTPNLGSNIDIMV